MWAALPELVKEARFWAPPCRNSFLLWAVLSWLPLWDLHYSFRPFLYGAAGAGFSYVL